MTKVQAQLLAWTIALLCGETALAQGAAAQPKILLLELSDAPKERQWPAALDRLAVELELAGFLAERVGVAAAGRELIEILPEEVGRQGAVAAITFSRDVGGAATRIALQDAVTGKTVLRTVQHSAGSENDVAEVALKAVELLNASLLELKLSSNEPPASPLPEPILASIESSLERIDATRQRESRVRGELGTSLLLSNEDLSPMPALELTVLLRLSSQFRLGAQLRAAIWPAEVTDELGHASVGEVMLALVLSYEPWPSWSISPFAHLGGGAFLLWATGDASVQASSRSDTAAALLVLASLGVRMSLTQALSLTASCDAMFTVPHLNVYFAKETVASVGLPILAPQLGLAYDF